MRRLLDAEVLEDRHALGRGDAARRRAHERPRRRRRARSSRRPEIARSAAKIASSFTVCVAQELVVDEILLHQHREQRAQAERVGAGPHLQVEVGELGGLGAVAAHLGDVPVVGLHLDPAIDAAENARRLLPRLAHGKPSVRGQFNERMGAAPSLWQGDSGHCYRPPMPSLSVRDEAPADIDAVREIVTLAFEQPAESALVDALRSAGKATISLVAERDGRVVGTSSSAR